MRNSLLLLGLAAAASAWPKPPAPVCKDVDILVTVSTPRFIINATIENDWDVAALTFNLTRRDSGMAADPLPINGTTPDPVKSTYMVGATLCGTGSSMLVLTHGIIESKLCVLSSCIAMSQLPLC